MSDSTSPRQRWAHFRFSVVGELLAAPPASGELRDALCRLSDKPWRHPITGKPTYFARSTIERWYYAAKAAGDPVRALARRARSDLGRPRAMPAAIAELIVQQYRAHPSWSYQLHYDNVAALVKEQTELGVLPSYSTLRRYMLAHGWPKQRREKPSGSSRRAREKRSFEAEHVNGLWHLDFHHGSRKVLTKDGAWETPMLLAILDDHSRLVCHLQWYLQETAECLIHGLVQAFIKRGLPRSLLSDNGSAMIADETREGLVRLAIIQRTTLPNSPHQNGKQEVFFASVESRLLAMLEGHADLDLGLLNRATLAWVEMEYHRKVHRETKQTPLRRFLESPSVARQCPDLDHVRLAFTASAKRNQRKGDGTISFAGTRYEIPSRFAHLTRLSVRYQSWDKSSIFLVDEVTDVALERLYPVDLAKNASGRRRPITPQQTAEPVPQASGIAPLLKQHMADYAATGLPPAYLEKDTP